MPTDVRTPELVINKLSKQQYDNIPNPDPNQLYLVPEEEEHKPICYPTTASEVKTTSMVVKSSVSDNGKILTENGFVYNTSGNPTISDNKVICDLGVGFFEKKLENLTYNTEYHIKSYGQNASGLVYGSELVQRTSNNPIPVEYQLVEYLESSGTQYIDTGIIPQLTDEIIAKVVFLNSNTQRMGSIETISSSSWRRCHFSIQNNNLTINYNTSVGILEKSYDTNQHIFSFTQNLLYIDELSNSNNCVYPISSSFYLFARNNSGTADAFCTARLSYFKIGNIELYPVYRTTDNKPGMYDIVNGVFYTNQGTGEFVVGPDKEFDE